MTNLKALSQRVVQSHFQKTAGPHRIGLPPYGSWKKFVDAVWNRSVDESPTPLTAVDMQHAIRELQGYAAHGPESSRTLAAAVDSIKDALKTHQEMAQLSRELDAQIKQIHVRLRQAGQIS